MLKSQATFNYKHSALPEDVRRLSSTGEVTLITDVIVGSELQLNCQDSDQKWLNVSVCSLSMCVQVVFKTELLWFKLFLLDKKNESLVYVNPRVIHENKQNLFPTGLSHPSLDCQLPKNQFSCMQACMNMHTNKTEDIIFD